MGVQVSRKRDCYISIYGRKYSSTDHFFCTSVAALFANLCKSLQPYGANLGTHTVANIFNFLHPSLQIFANLCIVCESLATAHPYGRYASDGAPRAALGVEGLVRPPKICKDGCKDGCKDLQIFAKMGAKICKKLQIFAPYACKDFQRAPPQMCERIGPWTICSFHR